METFLFAVFIIMLVSITLVGLGMMLVLLWIMFMAGRTLSRIVSAEFNEPGSDGHVRRPGSNPPLTGSVKRPAVPPSPTSIEL